MKFNEVWKDIKGYEGQYQISNYGRVLSKERKIYHNTKFIYTQREKILKNNIDKLGYHRINLLKNGVQRQFFVHRLVAQAFIPNPNNLPHVNHIDENPQNNRYDNLEWCDQKYNMNYGTVKKRISEKLTSIKNIVQLDKNGNVIKIWDNVKEITKEYNTYHIYDCLNGKRKTACGYIWLSEKEVMNNEL